MPERTPPPPPPGASDDVTLVHAAPDADWEAIEAEPQFRELVETKRRFIVPATVFFIVYYFANWWLLSGKWLVQ